MRQRFEKEEAFDAKWANGTASKNIRKYIPDRLGFDAVQNAVTNCNGYWIYLEDGWTAYDGFEDCGTIHEYTIADLKAAIRTIRRK